MLRGARVSAVGKPQCGTPGSDGRRLWAGSDRLGKFDTRGGLQTFVADAKYQSAKEEADLRHEYPAREQRKPAWRLFCPMLLYPPMSVFALPSKLGDAFAK